ncbi:hypothetical protein H0H92_004926 [Tricholoma furcatifolium]|nr:hypothetical protein H0H92_004926 [Tricholoma furcatifolium]
MSTTRGRSPSPRTAADADMDMDQSPSDEKASAKVVIVTNLTRNVVESHLQTIFSFYGTITKIDLPSALVHPLRHLESAHLLPVALLAVPAALVHPLALVLALVLALLPIAAVAITLLLLATPSGDVPMHAVAPPDALRIVVALQAVHVHVPLPVAQAARLAQGAAHPATRVPFAHPFLLSPFQVALPLQVHVIFVLLKVQIQV